MPNGPAIQFQAGCLHRATKSSKSRPCRVLLTGLNTNETMKYILPIALFLVLLGLFACKNDEPPHYSPELEARLSGLQPVELSWRQQDSIRSLIRSKNQRSFPVYSPAGEVLSQEEILKKKINMYVDCFLDCAANIAATVFRPATQAEIAARMEAVSIRHKQQEQTVADWQGKYPAPFTATDLHGNRVDLKSLKGKIVVLNFWFIRCHACVQEMPELNRIVSEFGDKEVVFLGLTFDEAAETKAFLDKTRFDYQILPDAQPIFWQFGIGPCPVNLVINREGKVVYSKLGYEAANQSSYEQLRYAIQQALHNRAKP